MLRLAPLASYAGRRPHRPRHGPTARQRRSIYLQQRRATIVRTDNRGAMVTVEAHAPLRELFGYSSAMRSLSQGRAGASMEPLEYAAAPAEVVKEFEL